MMVFVRDIYRKYKIMLSLQLHMLRCAAVAKLVIDNFEVDLDDEREIITAVLLHDMGNIIKFDLSLYPEFLEPKGLKYWQKVQQEFREKYGRDEHSANVEIINEIGVSNRVKEIVKSIGFSKSLENSLHNDYSKKIATYSDYRVAPYGITSLEERELEGKERYANRINKDLYNKSEKKFRKYFEASKLIEKQISARSRISPEEIKDESVDGIIEELKDFKL